MPRQRPTLQMRNIMENVRKRDRAAVKREAQAIYRAASLQEARQAFYLFQSHWQASYPRLV